MFNIEIRFKVGDRDVPFDSFMGQFFRECLGEMLNGIITRLESTSAPVQPPAAIPAVTTPRPERRVVSVPEAAQLLGLRPSTLRAWISQRKIAFVHLGHRVVIPMEAIDDLLLRGFVPAKDRH